MKSKLEATAVCFVCLVGRAVSKEVEEKDKQDKPGPSKLTALYHGPGGCRRFDGV